MGDDRTNRAAESPADSAGRLLAAEGVDARELAAVFAEAAADRIRRPVAAADARRMGEVLAALFRGAVV